MYYKELSAFLDNLVELPSVQQVQQDGLDLLEQASAARGFVVGQRAPSGLLEPFDRWFRAPEAVISQEYARDMGDRLVSALAG